MRPEQFTAPVAGHLLRSGIVLGYHDIIADSAPVYRYAVRRSVFRQQLRTVRSLGYRFVPFAELSAGLLRGEPVAGLAAVLFDDALVGVYRHALPWLTEQHTPWTLLPVTARLGTAPPWWAPADRTMTRTEVTEAVAAGAQLAGHTATHPSLPQLSDAAVREELTRSRELLSEWGNREVTDLCYPFGHQDARVRALTAAAGYRTGWTFTNGRCRAGDEPFRLHRMAMHDGLRGPTWWKTLLRPHWTWPAVTDTPASPAGRPA
ncbi:polysaccharide deacetylase family protein [Corynebacterium halotolerans]|uniref:polysaccharide deacetylase family protein n=1 Tax=Corynebacterium halotolerans TaxID=225326 RepID=UPI003CE6BDE2